MPLSILDLFFQENNFQLKNGISYGFYRNRFFALNNVSGLIKISTTLSKLIEESKLQQISNEINRVIQSNQAYAYYEFGTFTLSCFLNPVKTNDNLIIDTMSQMTDILDMNDIPNRDTCPICNRTLTPSDPIYNFDNELFQSHEACATPLIQMVDNALTSRFGDTKKQHYFTGILGVLLSGILFIGIYLLLESAKYFACIASIISVCLAHFLYKKFNGKMVKNRLILISVIMELFVILGEYFLLAYTSFKSGTTLAFALTHPFRNFDVLQCVVHLLLNTFFIYGSFLFLWKAEKKIPNGIKKF